MDANVHERKRNCGVCGVALYELAGNRDSGSDGGMWNNYETVEAASVFAGSKSICMSIRQVLDRG